MSDPRRIVVVAGLISHATEPLYLLTRRLAGGHLPLSWEFPGGKIEAGESPEVALVRELAEELGIEVEVGEVFAVGHHVYPEKEVLLLVYQCGHVGGEPQCLAVTELRWLSIAEILELPLPPADAPVVARLRREAGLR